MVQTPQPPGGGAPAAPPAQQASGGAEVTLPTLLKAMVERNASDLHITAGSAPQLRIDGRLVPIRMNALTTRDAAALCCSILDEGQRRHLEKERELDLSFGIKNLSRFRTNLFYQRGGIAGVFRQIPFVIKSFDELGVPRAMMDLSRKQRGMVLITGPTGSGKTTTLASVIDLINTERQGHVVTVEDPIEYVHSHKSCVVTQREVGADTHGFSTALKAALRQDPDVVLIGEMRDLETVAAALTIAETGHLTFATLHTNSAIQTINRIIDVFPPHQQSQVRSQLSFVLHGVLSQELVPKMGGGRVLATELMLINGAIRNLIREDKIHQIYSSMQVGRSRHAMHTMNNSLFELVKKRQIRPEDAMATSPDPDELSNLITTAPVRGR